MHNSATTDKRQSLDSSASKLAKGKTLQKENFIMCTILGLPREIHYKTRTETELTPRNTPAFFLSILLQISLNRTITIL
jgi:hypothetical protein